jgi:hypothetical protein
MRNMKVAGKPFTAQQLAYARHYIQAECKQMAEDKWWLGISPAYLIYNVGASLEEARALLTELTDQGFLERSEGGTADVPRYFLAGTGLSTDRLDQELHDDER